MSATKELILVQSDAAAHFLLKGLQQEYMHAVASDRLALWSRAAYAVVELLADRAPPVFPAAPSPLSPKEEA